MRDSGAPLGPWPQHPQHQACFLLWSIPNTLFLQGAEQGVEEKAWNHPELLELWHLVQ